MKDDNIDQRDIESDNYSADNMPVDDVESMDEPAEEVGETSAPDEYMPDAVDTRQSSYQQYKAKQDYYRKEAETLRRRQQELDQRKKARQQEEKKKEEDDSNPESSPTPANQPSENKPDDHTNDNQTGKEDKASTGDNKKDDKQKQSALGAKIDNAKSKVNAAQTKINSVKQTANKVAHPINATKAAVEEKVKKKVVTFLLKWWWLVGIIAIFFLIFLLLLLIILGASGEEYDNDTMIDPTYDISQTMVTVTNDYRTEAEKVEIERVSLMDYALGAAYLEFRGKLDNKSTSEKLEIYKTYFIVAKSILLSLGNYDSETKEITIKNGLNGMPYCDPGNGCKVYNNNGYYTYVSANNTTEVPGVYYSTIEPISSSELSIMVEAYNDTSTLLLVPKTLNSAFTKYDFARPSYNQTIKDRWISNNYKYEKKISNTPEYNDFKIYDIKDYAFEYTYASSSGYWWPIGSSSPTNGQIYGGSPSATYVSSTYGPRTIQGKYSFHTGLDIADRGCSSNVIIATRAGTVIEAKGGCASTGYYGNTCNGGNGNYVKIDHGDGTVSLYAHLTKDSIVVKKDQAVAQGQKLGLMGSSGSSTGCHLHFGIYINGSHTDPLNYINASNPRPSSEVEPTYQTGSNNMQSVCLTLKSSKFSDNAVAAIMTNIQAESSFRPDLYGDKGTSYGLCQWHNGRFTNLKSYCGSNYTTVKCQMNFLVYELQASYKGVYNKLLSNSSAYDMASYYCINFEVPANRYQNCPNRATKYSSQMLTYVKNGCK